MPRRPDRNLNVGVTSTNKTGAPYDRAYAWIEWLDRPSHGDDLQHQTLLFLDRNRTTLVLDSATPGSHDPTMPTQPLLEAAFYRRGDALVATVIEDHHKLIGVVNGHTVGRPTGPSGAIATDPINSTSATRSSSKATATVARPRSGTRRPDLEKAAHVRLDRARDPTDADAREAPVRSRGGGRGTHAPRTLPTGTLRGPRLSQGRRDRSRHRRAQLAVAIRSTRARGDTASGTRARRSPRRRSRSAT